MLYELGGRDQIGACDSIAEARAKVGRLLDGDPALVAEIIRQQRRILEHFSWEYCVPEWKRVLSEHVFAEDASQPVRRRRIGVFLPVAYRGGSLNTAINQALMLKKGSEAAGEGVDVVFSYVKGDYDRTRDFHRLTENGITLRETTWREITREELQIANKFRGVESRLDATEYVYPSDGASNFLDCDFWYLVSDRTPVPLAPMRPYSVFIADCLQRVDIAGESRPRRDRSAEGLPSGPAPDREEVRVRIRACVVEGAADKELTAGERNGEYAAVEWREAAPRASVPLRQVIRRRDAAGVGERAADIEIAASRMKRCHRAAERRSGWSAAVADVVPDKVCGPRRWREDDEEQDQRAG